MKTINDTLCKNVKIERKPKIPRNMSNESHENLQQRTCCSAETFSSSITANCVTEWSRLPPLRRWLDPHPEDVRKFDLLLAPDDPPVALLALPIFRRLQWPSAETKGQFFQINVAKWRWWMNGTNRCWYVPLTYWQWFHTWD